MQKALALMKSVMETGEPIDRPDLLVGIEDIMALMGYDEARALEARLLTTDADQTVRALLRQDETACNLDVRSVGLEDAFLALTGSVH